MECVPVVKDNVQYVYDSISLCVWPYNVAKSLEGLFLWSTIQLYSVRQSINVVILTALATPQYQHNMLSIYKPRLAYHCLHGTAPT